MMNKKSTQLPFGIPRDLGILAVTQFIWGLGEGLFIFFCPLALQYWGIDPAQIGMVLSFLGVAMALVQAPAGYFSDRFGTRPIIWAALILGVMAAGMMAAANSLPVFIAGLVAYSLTSFIGAPMNSYLTSARGDWSVQRAITFVSGSMQLGAIVGPMLGGWIAQTAGMPMVFRYATGLFAVATAVAFFVRRPAAQQETQAGETPTAHLLTNRRFIGALFLFFFTIIALSTPQQLTSVYLQEVHGLSLQQIGMTGTFAGIGTMVILFALGGMAAPYGMMLGQLFIALFSLLMWRGQGATVFYIGYLFIGGFRLYRSMAASAIRPLVRPSDMGLAYGLVETINALAVILAPLAAGFLYRDRPEAVYIASLISLSGTLLLTVIWHRWNVRR